MRTKIEIAQMSHYRRRRISLNHWSVPLSAQASDGYIVEANRFMLDISPLLIVRFRIVENR